MEFETIQKVVGLFVIVIGVFLALILHAKIRITRHTNKPVFLREALDQIRKDVIEVQNSFDSRVPDEHKRQFQELITELNSIIHKHFS